MLSKEEILEAEIMEIKIEPVKRNEVQMLCDISSKCFYDTFYKQNSKEDMNLFLEKSFTANVMEQEMMLQNNYFFFARAGNEIVGYIKLSDAETPDELRNSNALEIARIYVLRQKIGSGIGKSLMEFALSFARQLHKQVIWLGVWEHNNPAINFYRKWGFEKFNQHIFMLGNDVQNDWLMKKELRL